MYLPEITSFVLPADTPTRALSLSTLATEGACETNVILVDRFSVTLVPSAYVPEINRFVRKHRRCRVFFFLSIAAWRSGPKDHAIAKRNNQGALGKQQRRGLSWFHVDVDLINGLHPVSDVFPVAVREYNPGSVFQESQLKLPRAACQGAPQASHRLPNHLEGRKYAAPCDPEGDLLTGLHHDATRRRDNSKHRLLKRDS